MKNTGLVTEICDDKIKVRFIKESACGGNCASCGACNSKPVEILIKNTLGAKCGDKVEVESDTGKILFSAFLLYIVPLIILISVYLIANMFAKEIYSIILSVIAFFLSFLGIRNYGKKFKNETTLIRILEDI